MGLACIYQGSCTKKHAAMCIMYTLLFINHGECPFSRSILRKMRWQETPSSIFIYFSFSFPFRVLFLFCTILKFYFFGFFHPFPPGCNLSCRNLHKCFIFCELKLLAVLESIPPGSQAQRPSDRGLVLIGVLAGFAEGEGRGGALFVCHRSFKERVGKAAHKICLTVDHCQLKLVGKVF